MMDYQLKIAVEKEAQAAVRDLAKMKALMDDPAKSTVMLDTIYEAPPTRPYRLLDRYADWAIEVGGNAVASYLVKEHGATISPKARIHAANAGHLDYLSAPAEMIEAFLSRTGFYQGAGWGGQSCAPCMSTLCKALKHAGAPKKDVQNLSAGWPSADEPLWMTEEKREALAYKSTPPYGGTRDDSPEWARSSAARSELEHRRTLDILLTRIPSEIMAFMSDYMSKTRPISERRARPTLTDSLHM